MATSATLDPDRFDAALFDLDGVLTDTAALHATCWKELFDDYLRGRAEERGEAFRAFEIETDYRRYVDGKRRSDGVRDFLASRGIRLPEGDPEADPERGGEDTVASLGRRKDALVQRAIARDGVLVFEDGVRLARALLERGLRTAVVSSSKNCGPVLAAAGIEDLFEDRVDGVVAAELGLAGKPAPAMFLEAARRLAVSPARALVVEDAIAGVEAGRAGEFGLVVGVARHGDARELSRAGADRVVTDLGELLP